MRAWALLLITLIAASASADRLISIPTARKLTYRTVRYELQMQPGQDRRVEHFLGIGLGPAFELELRSQDLPDRNAVGTFDFAYNYISPIPDLTPGIAFGVQDALDKTSDGQRFYLAIGFRPMFSTIGGDVPGDVTLGVMLGRKDSGFVGVAVPFSREVRFLAEHNGYRISSGFELLPLRNFAFRVFLRDQDLMAGFWMARRF